MTTTAIVHDYLVTFAGSERVLEQILRLYPDADVFTLIDALPDEERGFLDGHDVTTSFLQRVPTAKRGHHKFFPLFPRAVESLDLSGYDLVISSSHAVAKGAATDPDATHISYCHSPMRWAWDLRDQYLREAGLDSGPTSWVVRNLLERMRRWDERTADRVDRYAANSRYIAERIRRAYGRDATVVYPPVDTDTFTPAGSREGFYLVVSRLVWYKQVGTVVDAFARLPDQKLVVVGDGPQFEEIRRRAGSNVDMRGHVPQGELLDLMRRARALVFPPEEDFGITPVEAMACGTPVLAFGRGGATETVVDGETGLYFHEQTPEAIVEAVKDLESLEPDLDPKRVRANAERFGVERFRKEFQRFVDEAVGHS